MIDVPVPATRPPNDNRSTVGRRILGLHAWLTYILCADCRVGVVFVYH